MLKLPYLNATRNVSEDVYQTLVGLRNAVLQLAQTTGGSATGMRATPDNSGSIAVTEDHGNYHIRIADPTSAYGEFYFVEYATKPDFSNAILIYDGASRSSDIYLNLSVSTYWRFYKQMQGSAPSSKVTYGNPPIAIAGTGTGSAPPAGTGSGTSSGTGSGFGGGGTGAHREVL